MMFFKQDDGIACTVALSLVGCFLLVGYGGTVAAQDTADQPPAEISGIVTDPLGAPVGGVTVVLRGPSQFETRTDHAGRFAISGAQGGDYVLTVDFPGFSTSEMSLALEPGTRQDVELTLDLAPFTGYVETVSKAHEEPMRVPFNVTTIDERELEKIVPATLEDTLRVVPGLQHGTQANAFTRIAVRGLRDTKDLLVLMDGIPFRLLDGSGDLTMIPASLLQGIEFVKGPASSMYGRGGVSGTVNFRTLPAGAEKAGGDWAFTMGSWNTYEGKVTTQVPLKKGSFSVAGLVSRSDNYQEDTGRDQNFLNLSFQHFFSDRVGLKLQYLYSDVYAGRGTIIPLEDGRPMFGIRREDNFAVPNARFDSTLNFIVAQLTWDLPNGWSLSNTANYSRYNRFFTGGVTIVPPPTTTSKYWYESDGVLNNFFNDLILSWEKPLFGATSTLLLGTTFEDGKEDRGNPSFRSRPTFQGPDYVNPVGNPDSPPTGIRGSTTFSFFEQQILSFYAQERLQWDRFGLVAGLRWDGFDQLLERSNTGVISKQDRSRVSPRLGFDYGLVRDRAYGVALFGNLAEGYRPQFPTLSTRSGVTLPQLLDPEVSRNLEAGVKVSSNRLFAQISLFEMRKIDGQRSYRTSPEDFLFTNASSRVRGVESEVRVLVAPGRSIWVHYSYHDPEHTEFKTATSDFSGMQIRMAPNHIAGAGFSLEFGRFTWIGSVNFVGERPLRDNTVDPMILPSYTTMNTSLSREFKNLRFTLSVSNLTDEYYIADDFSSRDAGSPGMPRWLALQVAGRF